jgi:hypothetical protein
MEVSRMFLRKLGFCAASVVLLAACAPALQAQTAPAPTTYTLTETNAMFGPVLTVNIYRNGSKAVSDSQSAASAAMPKAIHTRALYDLKTQQSLSWDVADSSIPCGKSNFSGSWGDPFVDSASLLDGLNKQNPKQVGTETVLGFSAKVLEVSSPNGTMRVWVDTKYGLMLKAQSTPPKGAPQTIIEVTKVSFTAPSASVFAVPANCAAAAAAPLPPTEAERIAAETGDNAGNYVNAIYGPGSKNSCTAILRVVRAKSMTPITNRLQVAIDTTYNVDNPPHYVSGMGVDGSQTFSGGGIHEITNQIHNGTVRLGTPPAYFMLDVNLMKPGTGASEALIYRQCFAPTTILLFVVKDADNPSAGGDFLWVKSGKYATLPN